ncbi:hypothetical protein SAMN05428959_102314 [Duganella sp. CF517]|uniref:hypothetical protein n=1 Tax=Duganella sp. CF517 TaxID=1881038 RepID=UPI0008B8CE8A|nr:hypothetical protein [Duganella sp. CF517]SEN54109.1 hypothetical protein SAMN05428959_102314 [Duganella sp. CF517]
MTTITPYSRDTAANAAAGVTASASRAISPGASGPVSGSSGGGASTTVSLSGGQDAGQPKAVVWENRTRSTASTIMARNFAEQPVAGRLKGLGGELLKQVAYDGENFSQSIQQAPTGMQADTYDMLVSPSPVSQHGMGDNRIGLTITTRSGVTVELSLDAGDNSIAFEAKSSGKLTEVERKALGKLSDAFQKAVDGLAEDPPRVDLAGLTQFDGAVLSSVDLKGEIKLNPKETQRLEFHADGGKRTLSFSGPDGAAKIGVDLSQPASWGNKEQQAKALNRYLQQVDQAGMRGQGNAAMLTMFKDALVDMNSDYGTPPLAPRDMLLTERDRATTTGLADFTASVTQTEVASNPAKSTEKDRFAYELSQKTTISGRSQMDLALSQQQQSHLKARYHAPASPTAKLALDLEPQSQNYKYIMVDESASSTTSIEYDKGKLVKASLEMQASRSTRVLEYMFGKLKDDHTTPSGKALTRDLLPTLDPEDGGLSMDDYDRARILARVNDAIFLQSDPDALAAN